MLNWFTRARARRLSATNSRRTPLRLEALEAREVPAILIQVDYTYDNGFFLNNPEARATVERVAAELGNSISANLAALVPAGSNQWTASFFNPATGAQTSVANMAIGANTIKLFVGARDLPGASAGVGGYGGYGVSGSASWIGTVQTRGWGGFSLWGGSLAIDNTIRWHFGQTTAGLDANELDFYSVATHEIGHMLGIGTANQWKSLVSGGAFRGGNAMAVYGGPVPVSGDGAHWADGITVGGTPVSLDPSLSYGQRVNWTALDAAALRDIGWGAPGATAAPQPEPTAPTFTRVPVAGVDPVGFAGGADGTLTEYVLSNGVLTPNGQKFVPFAGYRGVLRIAGGDFNGDGFQDFAVATGAGPQSVIQIINGRDGSILLGQTVIFPGFRGGLFISAGDIDGDGRADLAVAADGGAGPHVQTFRVLDGRLVLQSSFFAFDNPNFRGGVRVALGDVNHDGFADLVATTGGRVEGRVAIYSGATLRYNSPARLTGDFIAYRGFYGALNAALGDMDGDGLAELALSPDQGTVGHVKVWSGAALVSNPNPNNLPAVASFYAFPANDPSGARLAIHDLDGDGRDELVAASGNAKNSAARAFTFAQAVAGGGGAATSYPLGTVTINGLYAGLQTSAPDTSAQQDDAGAPARVEAPNAGDYTFTATAAPVTHNCTCGACTALAQLAAVADPTGELVPTIHVA